SPIVAANCAFRAERNWERENARLRGGGGGIRTPETLSGLTVFKTAGFNHSPTPPLLSLTGIGQCSKKKVTRKKTGPQLKSTAGPRESIDKNYLWMNLLL